MSFCSPLISNIMVMLYLPMPVNYQNVSRIVADEVTGAVARVLAVPSIVRIKNNIRTASLNTPEIANTSGIAQGIMNEPLGIIDKFHTFGEWEGIPERCNGYNSVNLCDNFSIIYQLHGTFNKVCFNHSPSNTTALVFLTAHYRSMIETPLHNIFRETKRILMGEAWLAIDESLYAHRSSIEYQNGVACRNFVTQVISIILEGGPFDTSLNTSIFDTYDSIVNGRINNELVVEVRTLNIQLSSVRTWLERLTDGGSNTALGYVAAVTNTIGNNTALGYESLSRTIPTNRVRVRETHPQGNRPPMTPDTDRLRNQLTCRCDMSAVACVRHMPDEVLWRWAFAANGRTEIRSRFNSDADARTLDALFREFDRMANSEQRPAPIELTDAMSPSETANARMINTILEHLDIVRDEHARRFILDMPGWVHRRRTLTPAQTRFLVNIYRRALPLITAYAPPST